MQFGKLVGRFFLKEDLGLEDDDTPNTVTVSELVETFSAWPDWIKQLSTTFTNIQLFTMFETSDVHPDIIEKMKLFSKVIVPYDYLKDILIGHGVNCEAMNWWTSPLIRTTPQVLNKPINPNKLVFLYVGTNEIPKNVVKLTEIFKNVFDGTEHKLIVKTNKTDNLHESKNIKCITNRLSYSEMAGLYNICDYVISFSRGEGVGLPMLEAKYFGKPVISHDGGVLSMIKDESWIVLPSHEILIDTTDVPDFLLKVFYGTWWEVDSDKVVQILKKIGENIEP